MKLLSLLIALSILSSLLSRLSLVATIESKNDNYVKAEVLSSGYTFEAVGDIDYHFEEENRVVYGNYSDFDFSLLYGLIHDENRLCIFYDLDLSDNVNNNHEIMRNNAVVYYHKNSIPYVHSYISNSVEEQCLINDIENYVNEILSEIDVEDDLTSNTTTFLQQSPYTSGTELFESLYAGSFREEEQPYGYIGCNYIVKKHRTDDVSSLYLVEATVSFTPGKIVKDLGNTNYDNWYNSTGYIKIKATRASNEVDINQVRYGGTPVFKDAYPINSFGSVSHSRRYQMQEPSFSAQKDPSDVDMYTWLYTYFYPRNDKNRYECIYMFEMNNSGHDLHEGDLALRFEYQMTVDNNGWWIFNKTYTFSGYSLYNYH